MELRTIIVDDEPLARQRLGDLLSREPEVRVVADCGDVSEAVSAVRRLAPDLVILDIHMPEKDGFAVIEEIGPQEMPPVIFVTAHDAHAIRAFEVHAVDYLLKPVDRARLRTALSRARSQLEQRRIGEIRRQLADLVGDLKPEPSTHAERLIVRSNGRVLFFKVDEIDWIDAAGNYVRLNAGDHSHLLRETMAGIESRLDPARFVRIHRSTIVNIDRVKELVQGPHGDFVVVLRNGKRLPLSRGYRERLEGALKSAF
jgi:two-component system, LytTR family, response regulator